MWKVCALNVVVIYCNSRLCYQCLLCCGVWTIAAYVTSCTQILKYSSLRIHALLTMAVFTYIIIQGDIVWQSDSASVVSIEVKITTETEEQLDNILTTFPNDTGNNLTTLKIESTTPRNDCDSSALHSWKLNSITTLACSLLAYLLLSRWSSFHRWILLLLGLFVIVASIQVSANNSCTERADVVVFIPRLAFNVSKGIIDMGN